MKGKITQISEGFLKVFKLVLNKSEQSELNVHQPVFEYMERGDCVSVLIVNKLDATNPVVILNKQFRVGPYIREGEEVSYSSAAGMIDGDELDIQAAIREAQEETGLVVKSIKRMGRMYTSPGGTTERTTFFIAEADFLFGQQLEPLDKSEGITCITEYLTTAEKRLDLGEINSLQLSYQLSCLRNLISQRELKRR